MKRKHVLEEAADDTGLIVQQVMKIRLSIEWL